MTGSRWVRPVAVAATVATTLTLALAGCASLPSEYGTPTHIPKPTTPIDSPEKMCGDGYLTPPIAASSTIWLQADEAWFHSGLVGEQSDTTVAVFVHQSNLGFCGWWTYSQYLAKHGVRSILLNLCGYGVTLCAPDTPVVASGADAVLAAAAWAHKHGATRVVAVGASMGGTTVILAASHDTGHQLDAVADLSGPISYENADITGATSNITIPSFFAVAPADEVVSVSQMQTLADGISSPEPIVHLDGNGHGWDMLHDVDHSGESFDAFADELAAFIEGTPPTG